MREHTSLSIGICRVPRAIWIPGTPMTVYRGTPLDMVRAMSSEMEPGNLSIRETVRAIAVGLEENRGIRLGLPFASSDELLAVVFVHQLLEAGLGRTLAEA